MLSPPPSFDLNLLFDVPTTFLKNNEAKTRTKNAVLAIHNLLKKEEEEKVIISNKINTILPEATKILDRESARKTVKKEIVIPNLDKFFDSLEKGQTSKQLQFFLQRLKERISQKTFLNKNDEKFADYLQSDKCTKEIRCQSILKQEILFNNTNSSESIYNFLAAKQNYNK